MPQPFPRISALAFFFSALRVSTVTSFFFYWKFKMLSMLFTGILGNAFKVIIYLIGL